MSEAGLGGATGNDCGVSRNRASGAGATWTDGPSVHAGIVGDRTQR